MKAMHFNFFAGFLGEFMDPHSVKPMASQVREKIVEGYHRETYNWKEAYKDGWRVRPVSVTQIIKRS
jgi:hypothetical protein